MQPSEVLDVLDWDDALALAKVVSKRRAEEEGRHAQVLSMIGEAQMKQMGQVMKAIEIMGKNIGKGLGMR